MKPKARIDRVIFNALIETLFIVTLFLMKMISRITFSRTGRENPLTKRLTTLGYALDAHRLLSPNIKRWLQGKKELFPAIVQIQTINRCNGRCVMCPYSYTVHLEEKGVMERNLYTKIADECTNEPALQSFVPMAQTEPLLDPHLEQRIAYFKAKSLTGQKVELVTNGSLLTASKLQGLVESGLDIVSISVNAGRKESYEKIMRGLSWERVIGNLEEIAQTDLSKVNLFVRFVKQKENYGEYPSFRKYWRRKGFNVLGIEVNNRSSSLQEYDNIKEPGAAKSLLKKWIRKHAAKRIFPVCPYAFSHLHVLHNGDVPMCVNDFEHREIMGNVQRERIREIFNSPRFQQVRRLMVEGRYDEIETCKHCTLWLESNWL